jgi:serine protease AprX
MLARAIPAVLLVAMLVPTSSGVSCPELRDGLQVNETVLALAVHKDTARGIAALDAAGVPHSDAVRVGVSQVLLSPATLPKLCGAPIIAFYPEAKLELFLAESTAIIHAIEAREMLGEDGRNATVLVIDTGIDGAHPDLMDRVKAAAQPHDPMETGLVPAGYSEGVLANDWFGHGTHVAGIVLGTGAGVAAPDPMHGKLIGVAPGAKVVSWAIPGLGNARTVFQGVQGFEYALEKQAEYGIQVITNSWGMEGDLDPEHPINVATLKAYQAGMAVIFAAGNSGKASGSEIRTNPFGAAPWTLMVASSTKDGKVSSFSSRGNEKDLEERPWNRPDLVAPGSAILAAKSRMGAMQGLTLAYAPSGGGDLVAQATHYQYASGTSMATPHVAGVLAMVFSANPTLSPDQAYDILVRTADTFENGKFHEVGVGLVNASAAVQLARATEGQREAFLAGERAYEGTLGMEFDAVDALSRPVPLPEPPVVPQEEAKATPLAGVAVLVLALMVAVVLRRK